MDSGQVIAVVSRLVLGAAAAFFAIMVWSKTRDPAWMLAAAGVLTAYAATVYSILELCGLAGNAAASSGQTSLVSIILPVLPSLFFIAAFAVMTRRAYRR